MRCQGEKQTPYLALLASSVTTEIVVHILSCISNIFLQGVSSVDDTQTNGSSL